jgi:PKD repeat protein
MKLVLLNIAIFLITIELAYPQQNNVWAFGYNCGINFNTNPPTIFVPVFREKLNRLGVASAASSVSDCNGNLLFYTSGCQIWNRNQQPMPNGTLVGDCNYGLLGEWGGADNVLIIPNTYDSLKYTVIYSVSSDPSVIDSNSYNGIYYCEVNMNLQGGLGDVDSIKDIRICRYSSFCLAVIPDSNNKDYWIITKPTSDSLYSFKLANSFIDTIPIKSFGLGDKQQGIIKPSHNYKNIATTCIWASQSTSAAILYDFNRNTGQIMNPKALVRQNQLFGKHPFGVEFSPNDSLIYLSTPLYVTPWLNSYNRLLQVERYAYDIPSTLEIIGNTLYVLGLQIGPDNKIYVVNNSNGQEKIGVINKPNLKGKACIFNENQYMVPPGSHDAEILTNLYFPVYCLNFKTISETNNCITDSARFVNQSDTHFVSYTWVFGDGDSLTVYDKRLVTHKYISEGEYYVKLFGKLNNNNTCISNSSYSDSITVRYKPTAFISYDSIKITCPSQTLFMKDTSYGGIRSEWYWGDSSSIDTGYFASHLYDTSGVYNIKLTSFNQNCSDTDSIQVHININHMPVADFILSDSVECFNNNLFQLTNTSSGKGNLKYLWQFGDGDTSTLFDTLHSYHSEDTFNIMLVCSSDSVCMDTAVKSVIVHASPNSSFNVSDTVQCFIDNYFTLVNSSTINEGTISFFWDFGNSVTSKVFETSIHYDSIGNYNVSLVATSGFGCTDTNIIQMQVKPEPVATFMIDDSLQCLAGNKFSFTNNSIIQNDTFSSYWNFGDDTISLIPSPIYSYMDTGIFKVTLITTSSIGCKDTISKKVTIFPDPSVLSVSGEDHCGTGKVHLSAKAENGGIYWYSYDVGGTILYQGDTFFTNAGATYYVEAVNPGCASSPRTPISTTVKYIPKIISTTPTSNLLPASLTLRAFADNGIVNWYDTSVGGVLLANGTSFTTPFLDSSKMYYVDATYLGCTTLSRTGIKAHIGPNSINDHFNEVQVIFYPNPVNDVLIIEINNLNEKATLTFIDVQGRIVKTVNLKPVNSKITGQIDLHDLPQGLYMLNLRNDSVYRSGRLVKF